MSATDASPRLAVIEVTAFRPDQPAYHAKVQTLIAQVLLEAENGGWNVSRHAAADVTTADLLEATDAADGIVIVGGEDITPRFYGGRAGYVGETRHYDQADAGQIAVVLRALSRETPLLGICRGLQVINVALGGDVIQHIEDEHLHRTPGVPIDQVLMTHPVSVLPGSALAASLGGTDILVESAHHQGVGRLGDGLSVAAVAPDGLIEALEHDNAPITGVQWHPEAPAAARDQLPLLLSSLHRRVAAVTLAA